MQQSPDQSGFLSPRYTHEQHSMTLTPPRTDPGAIFAQRDAEYMHAYQTEYMWQQQQQQHQQQRRASMGASMLYHNAADYHGTSASSSRGLRWDTPQPQRDKTARFTPDCHPGAPDKRLLPSAAELNLPGWL